MITAAFMSLALILAMPFAQGAPQDPHCNDILEGINWVDAKFETEQEVGETFTSTYNELLKLATSHNYLPNSGYFLQDLLAPAFRKITRFREKVLDNSVQHAAYKASMRSWTTNIEEYDKRSSVGRYIQYASPVQRYFSAVLMGYGAITSNLHPAGHLNIVDLGAGVGDSTAALRRLFPNARIVATDKSQIELTTLELMYPDVLPLQHDFKKSLPFSNSKLDLVTSITAAAQFLSTREFESLLREVHRTLKPGGYFLFEFAPHTQGATGLRVIDFIAQMRSFGFEPQHRIELKIYWRGQSVYPILLKKI